MFIIHLFCCIFFTVSKLTKFFVVLFNRLTFWCAFCYFTLSSLDLLRFGFCTWEIIRIISLLHSKFIVGISFISRFRLCILSHHLRYTFFRKTSYKISIFLFFCEIHTGLRLRNVYIILYVRYYIFFFIIYCNWFLNSQICYYWIVSVLFIVLFRNYDACFAFCYCLFFFHNCFSFDADKPRLFYVVSITST